jgi:hypothetical protein
MPFATRTEARKTGVRRGLSRLTGSHAPAGLSAGKNFAAQTVLWGNIGGYCHARDIQVHAVVYIDVLSRRMKSQRSQA